MKAATSQRPKGLIPVSLSCSWPRSIATLLLLPGGDVNPAQGYPQLGRRGGGVLRISNDNDDQRM